MKIKYTIANIILFFSITTVSHASLLSSMVTILRMIAASQGVQLDMQGDILNTEKEMLGVQRDLLKGQNNIEGLMKQVNGNMTGHSGLGDYQFHDYQSYGNGARDWSSILAMAGHGQGNGALGDTISRVNKDFPIDRDAYNKGISNRVSQQYYAMKSQTTLAARAASELDFNKIEDQFSYQQMLRQQIEKTNDLKAATDLSNRIQVEGNLISLQLLRQSTLINQQQAIKEEASIISALSNAKFLTKKIGAKNEN